MPQIFMIIMALAFPILFLMTGFGLVPRIQATKFNRYGFLGFSLFLTALGIFRLGPFMEGLKLYFIISRGDIILPYPGSIGFWILLGLFIPLFYCAVLEKQLFHPKQKSVEGPAWIQSVFSNRMYFLGGLLILMTLLIFMNLNSFVRVNAAGIDVNSFFAYEEKHYDWKDVSKIRVYLEEDSHSGRRGREYESVEPLFEVYFVDGRDLDLWNGHGFFGMGRTTHSDIRNIGHLAVSEKVKLIVENRDFVDLSRSKMGKLHGKDKANSIMGTFHYLHSVASGLDKAFPTGKAVSLKNIEFRVVDILREEQIKFCKSTRGTKTMGVLLEVRNNSKKPFSISGLYPGQLKVGKQAPQNSLMLCSDKFREIGPGEVKTGRLRFRVDESAKEFLFILKPSMFGEERVRWKVTEK